MKQMARYAALAILAVVLIAGGVLAQTGDKRGAGGRDTEADAQPTGVTRTTPTSPGAAAAGRRNLAQDESAGGHTLDRHVGKSDDELRARLRREPDISAASSYTDRETAERTVYAAIEANQRRIRDWVARGSNRANLALEVDMGQAIGRSVRQGSSSARNVDSAVVVLRASGNSWFVLTSYPQD